MDTVFRVIGYLSVPVVLIGVAVAIWSGRRERPLGTRTLLLVAGIGVAYLVVHDLLRGAEVSRLLGWLAAGAGVALGARRAWRVRLRGAGGVVLAKGDVWYLVLWGAAVVVAQVAALGAFGEGNTFGVYAVYLTTGLVLGVNCGLLVRLTRVRRGTVPASAVCPHCGSPVEADSCSSCGWQVAMPTPTAV